MAKDNFDACMAEIFAHEGGYVDHPKDPGGATNRGITHRTLADWRGKPVTKGDVKALSVEEAKAIYRARYWAAVRGDDLPVGVDLVTFDPAVNSGVRRGVEWLQRALGVVADGQIGPKTLAAAANADPVAVIAKACAVRMGFLRGLKTWGTFGKGWSARVARVEAVATRMAVEAAGRKARPALIAAKAEAEGVAKRESAAGATVALGTGGIGLADVPSWALAALAVLALVLLANQIGRRRYQLVRAAALQTVAEEAKA